MLTQMRSLFRDDVIRRCVMCPHKIMIIHIRYLCAHRYFVFYNFVKRLKLIYLIGRFLIDRAFYGIIKFKYLYIVVFSSFFIIFIFILYFLLILISLSY